MAEELSEPCASIAFMTNLVYDRGVALEYDLVHDRLEDAERRLADLEDMMPQVYGLTDLTTPDERADLVWALGKVRHYIQEGDAIMGQGAADEFNASFRNTMWSIIIRCKERVKQQPWLSPKEVVEHGSYIIFTNLDTGETKQYYNINPPDSAEAVSGAMLIKPYLEKRWAKNLKFEIKPAEKLAEEKGYYWEVTNMVTGETVQSGKRHESIGDAVRDAKKELRRGFQHFEDNHLVIKVFDKSPDERAGLTLEPAYSESFWVKPGVGAEPPRPFPETYGDWVNLAEDIKATAPDDLQLISQVNFHLSQIAEEEKFPEEASWSKQMLTTKAGELGIR